MAEATSVTPPAIPEPQTHGVFLLARHFRCGCGSRLLSFGGPAGQIAVMHRILVDEKRWVSESRFLHALNYCMLLPGPEAQQLATYIGWLMHRTAGGLMAGGLFILPGAICIMVLSWIYAAFGNVGFVAALFFGLKAAVLAIVLQAVVRVGSRALKNDVMRALAAIAFLAIFFLDVPFPVIVFGAAAIGFLGGRAGLPAFTVSAGHGGHQAAATLIVCSEINFLSMPGRAYGSRSPLRSSGWCCGSRPSLCCSWRSAAMTCSARLPFSSPRWRWSPLAVPMRFSLMSRSRPSITTHG